MNPINHFIKDKYSKNDVFMKKCSRCGTHVREQDIERVNPNICKNCWNSQDEEKFQTLRRRTF